MSRKVLASKLNSFPGNTYAESQLYKILLGTRAPRDPTAFLKMLAVVLAHDERGAADIERTLAGFRRSARIEGVSFVDHNGWTGEEFVSRLWGLDSILIEDLGAEWAAEPRVRAAVYMNYPQTWRVLVNEHGVVIGYWHFDPLTSVMYERAQSGSMLDEEITTAALMPFVLPGTYDIYMEFIGVLPEYRPRGFQMLFLSLFDVLEELAVENRILIGSVCANGLSGSGEKLCVDVGMKKLRQHRVRGTIFEDQMSEILSRLSQRSPGLFSNHQPLITSYMSAMNSV